MLPLFTSHGVCGWGEGSAGVSLPLAVAFLVCMPVDQDSEHAGSFFLSSLRRSLLTEWVGWG